MKSTPSFYLETAVATWRQTLSHERYVAEEDLDELELHVRDQVTHLVAKGYTEEEAFLEAMKEMGTQSETLTAYKSVYWGKVKRKRGVWEEVVLQKELVLNYVRVAFRTFLKQRNYAFINIAGLSTGLTCFVLIGLFVHFELSYDRFHEEADRIYRVAKVSPHDDYMQRNGWAVTPGPLLTALEAEFPEVEHAVQLQPVEMLMRQQENQFYEGGIYATASFFELFDFQLLQGNPASALESPDYIVLSESLARKYFGDINPVGQSLQVVMQDDGRDREITLTVTGIVKDPPGNSHFTFDYIVSMTTQNYYVEYLDHWDNNNYRTYAQLREDHDQAVFDEKLSDVSAFHLGQIEYYQDNPDDISTYFSQPLTDIHLHSKLNGELGENGDMRFVLLFSAIGLLILLIACINYVNLAMVRADTRSREVGVRKVMGANRGQLAGQFMGESILPTLCALVVAMGAAFLFLPLFNDLTARDMSLGFSTHAALIGILLATGLGAGILAGSYPAFVIASYQPGGIFKKEHRGMFGKTTLRNVLVTVQFGITIVLVLSTLVIRQQLAYTKNAVTGVEREQVIIVSNRNPQIQIRYDGLKQALEQHPGVVLVTASQDPPTRINSRSGARGWEGASEGERVSVYYSTIQHGFLDQFGIELVEGRDFFPDNGTDQEDAILINASLRDKLGWDTAVGRRFPYRGREARVIGVMENFNYLSFRYAMAPLALYLDTDNRFTYNNILVKINTENVQEVIAHIEESMATFSPGYPFDYQFLDEAYDAMYAREARLGNLFGYFTLLALLIAGMGLLGLAAYVAAGRKKEIGVRKVLGASKADILMLLSGDFARLVAIAFLLAVPVGYIGLTQWLEGFAFRVSLGWAPFAIAGGLVLVITVLTVSYQSLRAAHANSVQSLKYE